MVQGPSFNNHRIQPMPATSSQNFQKASLTDKNTSEAALHVLKGPVQSVTQGIKDHTFSIGGSDLGLNVNLGG